MTKILFSIFVLFLSCKTKRQDEKQNSKIKTDSIFSIKDSTVILDSNTFAINSQNVTKKQDGNENSKINSDDIFSFKIKGATDIIDSKKGTLNRQYNNKNIEVPLEFTEIEMQKIESLYRKLKLDTLPNNYEPNCEINIIPTFYDEFEIIYKVQRKQFIFNSDFVCVEIQSKKNLSNIEKFSKFIFEIVNQREKVKSLENSDIIFL